MMSVGFIGLGNIGKPMAKQLLKLSEAVWVFDVVPAACAELAAIGAHVAASPAELAKQCRIIGICVRDDKDVDSLLYGPEGIFANAAADTIVAIHSTVTQDATLRWHRDGAVLGLHVIDAPITGGAGGAAAGTLCYMVGGDEAIIERCRPVFLCSGSKIVHGGPIGTGIALKLCNNLMTYAAFIAAHEGFKLAAACGLAAEKLLEVGQANGVVTSQMSSFLLGRNSMVGDPAMLQKHFAPHAALGKKDLGAALQSAEKLNVALPGTQKNSELIEDEYLNRY
jgi:3-hydroxyisobutyrate dehydrogenase-like beta-hydroxyacid dehydrogenase